MSRGFPAKDAVLQSKELGPTEGWWPISFTPIALARCEVVSVREVNKVMMVPEVNEVVSVMKVSEVVSWKHRAMVDHAKVVWAAEAVHATEAVASHAAHHRVGRHHWRGKHRHHDSTSDRDFAEHDNPPDCPRAIVRTQCKMFK
jgi:hypothetical protein